MQVLCLQRTYLCETYIEKTNGRRVWPYFMAGPLRLQDPLVAAAPFGSEEEQDERIAFVRPDAVRLRQQKGGAASATKSKYDALLSTFAGGMGQGAAAELDTEVRA